MCNGSGRSGSGDGMIRPLYGLAKAGWSPDIYWLSTADISNVRKVPTKSAIAPVEVSYDNASHWIFLPRLAPKGVVGLAYTLWAGGAIVTTVFHTYGLHNATLRLYHSNNAAYLNFDQNESYRAPSTATHLAVSAMVLTISGTFNPAVQYRLHPVFG